MSKRKDGYNENRRNKIMSRETKIFIYVLISLVVFIGAIVPFMAQFILPFYYPNERVAGAEVWNQYVSIILGIIATVLGVVSLILSIRNEEQTYETEMRTRELIIKLKKNVKEVSEKQQQVMWLAQEGFSESRKTYLSLANGQVINNDEVAG